MIFEQVEIMGFEATRSTDKTEGVVAFIAAERRVSVYLVWKPFSSLPHPVWRNGLLQEALRQVRRMPEFRRGPEPMLAPEILSPVSMVA